MDFLLFISNYVLGLIVSVATSRGHTRVSQVMKRRVGGLTVTTVHQMTPSQLHSGEVYAVSFTDFL